MEFRVIEAIWEHQKELNLLQNVLKNYKTNGHRVDYFCDKGNDVFKKFYNEIKEGQARPEFVYTLLNNQKSFLEYVFNTCELDKNTALQQFSTYRKITLKASDILNLLKQDCHLFKNHTKIEEQATFKNNAITSVKSLLKKSQLYLTTENDAKYLINTLQKENSFEKK